MQIYLNKKMQMALVMMLGDAEGFLSGGDWGMLASAKNQEHINALSDGVQQLTEKLEENGISLESTGLQKAMDEREPII
ncbi:hypothetical protein [Jeotgalibacillus aurantiacus]|uniref:hypothetical protein n=1 Tax=Jeotgalibacillus aurantiacus TaxID=2763266 RepID=UPI001D0BC9F4|nr:hypothetical protein [Jeotgalibacillus aurantiacus]